MIADKLSILKDSTKPKRREEVYKRLGWVERALV